MGTLIIDEDYYSRAAARSLLLASGGSTVFEARDLPEARHYLDREGSRLDLILAKWKPEQGMDLPLGHLLRQRESLDHVPFVLMLQDRVGLGFVRGEGQSRISRVDAHLYKPFGSEGLRNAVRAAHRHRATMRYTLLLLGERFHSDLNLAILSHSSDFHWIDVKVVTDREALAAVLEKNPFRIGAVLIDPEAVSDDDWSGLVQYKKTPAGLNMPLICLSRKMEKIGALRLCSDVFIEPPPRSGSAAIDLSHHPEEAWDSLLRFSSERVISGWEVRQDLSLMRSQLREGNLREARRSLKRAMSFSPDRWECQEAAGDLSLKTKAPQRALEHFERALQGNPCTAHSQLARLSLLPDDKRGPALAEALYFCPQHPEIQKAVQR